MKQIHKNALKQNSLVSYKISITTYFSVGSDFENKQNLFVTLQHANVHSIVSSLGHAEHHVQTFFDFALPLLTAREQLLAEKHTRKKQSVPFSTVANF